MPRPACRLAHRHMHPHIPSPEPPLVSSSLLLNCSLSFELLLLLLPSFLLGTMPSPTSQPPHPKKPPSPQSSPAPPFKSSYFRGLSQTLDTPKSQVTSRVSPGPDRCPAIATHISRSKPLAVLPSLDTTPSRNLHPRKPPPTSTTTKASYKSSDYSLPLRKLGTAGAEVYPHVQTSSRVSHGRDERPSGAAHRLRDEPVVVMPTYRQESCQMRSRRPRARTTRRSWGRFFCF